MMDSKTDGQTDKRTRKQICLPTLTRGVIIITIKNEHNDDKCFNEV